MSKRGAAAASGAAATPSVYRSVKDLPLHADGAPNFEPVLGATTDGSGGVQSGLKIPKDSYILQFPADTVLSSRKAAETHLAALAAANPPVPTGLAHLREVREEGTFRALFYNSKPATTVAVRIRGVSLSSLAAEKERKAALKAINVEWMIYGGGKVKSLWAIATKDIPKGAELLYDTDACAVTVVAVAAAADRKRKSPAAVDAAAPAAAAGAGEDEALDGGVEENGKEEVSRKKRNKLNVGPAGGLAAPSSAAASAAANQEQEKADAMTDISPRSGPVVPSSEAAVVAASSAASCEREHPSALEALVTNLRAYNAAHEVRADLCVSISDTVPLKDHACLLKAGCPSFGSAAGCQLPEHGAMALDINAWSLSSVLLPPGYKCVGVQVTVCVRSMKTEEVQALQSEITTALSAISPFFPSFAEDGVPHPAATLAVTGPRVGESSFDLTEGASTTTRALLAATDDSGNNKAQVPQSFNLYFPMTSALESVPVEVRARSGLRLFVHAGVPLCDLPTAEMHHRFFSAFVDVARCIPSLGSACVPRA
jgi:hypothetical protein